MRRSSRWRGFVGRRLIELDESHSRLSARAELGVPCTESAPIRPQGRGGGVDGVVRDQGSGVTHSSISDDTDSCPHEPQFLPVLSSWAPCALSGLSCEGYSWLYSSLKVEDRQVSRLIHEGFVMRPSGRNVLWESGRTRGICVGDVNTQLSQTRGDWLSAPYQCAQQTRGQELSSSLDSYCLHPISACWPLYITLALPAKPTMLVQSRCPGGAPLAIELRDCMDISMYESICPECDEP